MSQALRRSTPCHPFRTAAAALGLAALAGCATNPVTGERELVLVSEAQEIEMGRQAAQQVEQSMGFVNDEELQAYVQRVGAQLAAASERPELPWTFRVVDDPTPNAFALPGGFIFFTRGMMSLMDSEAELATVLGHEIGHVTARHSVSQMTRSQLASLGLGIGGILFPELQPFGQIASAGLDLLFLRYGRDDERQSDELAFRYALSSGYDVSEADDVFLSLQRMGELEERSAIPSWLSTHPAPEERVERFRERQAELGVPQQDLRVGRAEYLQRIEGLIYGENPRNGFFRDGVFYHPDLRFRFAVPAQWQTQNLARAVLALSPQRDASLQLTLAADVEPAAALRQFLGQQGIRAGQAGQQSINAIPAAIGSFQAQTQQGVIQGLVAYLRYEGVTYQLLAYTPAGRYAQYDRLFQQIVGSFAPLTDPQILAVQPNRIEIVRVDRDLTLAQFDRAYPSAIPIERLALLNQVSGPDAVLRAGTLVKRVVAGPAAP